MLLILLLCAGSCNVVKRVNEQQLLLIKNTIYTDGKKVKDADVRSLIHQQPNGRLLGIPLRLNIYNLAAANPDSTFQNWLQKNPKRPKRLKSLLSEKQLNELRASYNGFNNWLKRTGEPPVVINTKKSQKTANRLKAYYGARGYFNGQVDFTIDTLNRKKRGNVNYNISLNSPYFLDSISHSIQSPQLDSLYEFDKINSLIKPGTQFNLSDLENERGRLTNFFRNSGVYNFTESAISFNILRDTLISNRDFTLPTELVISNASARINDTLREVEYKIYKHHKTDIFIDYNPVRKDSLSSVDFGEFTFFYNKKLKYRPEIISKAIFFMKDSIYSDLNRSRTYKQLSNLKTFSYPNIRFVADSIKNRLNTSIYLESRPRFSLGYNADVSHSNIQEIGISFGTSLISRNIFRGAETLEIKLRGSLGSSREASDNRNAFFNIAELGGDIIFNFPRIWFPLNTNKIIPRYMSPQTRASIGTSVQKNIGLDKQTFNAALRYSWAPSVFKKNRFDLMNLQYVRNVNPENFFNVYQNSYNSLNTVAAPFTETNPTLFDGKGDLLIPEGTDGFINDALNGTIALTSTDLNSVRSIDERQNRLTENNLILASNFTYEYNTRKGPADNSFYQFRPRIEIAGNTLSALSGIIDLEKDDNNQNLVFGVPYSQYVKTEFDFIKHWSLSRQEVLAFRIFMGVAIPYGNSSSIPFARSYFAGGSNDNRAWVAYSLGPGTTEAINEFNEANLKIAFNTEYRFPLFGNLKGAFFADLGNIWNIWDNIDDPQAVFENWKSLEELALGTGFGLRYDFTFFVLRADVGFKTYEPSLPEKNRWLINYNFANAVYNIGINYPF